MAMRHVCVLVIIIACSGCASGNELSCISCPDGRYLDQESISCQVCPANSRTSHPANASSVLECACEAGYTNASEVCGQCALGRFKGALGNVTCDVCPAHTNTTATGRVELAECLCVAGFFLQHAECVPCAAGTSKAFVGNDACPPCALDTFCPEQSVVPVSCVADSTRRQKGGRSVQDCLCLPGFLTEDSDDGRVCVQCPVGTYNEDYGSAEKRSTVCTQCPRNTFNPLENSANASVCLACDVNSESPKGSSNATACVCHLGFSGVPGSTCVGCAVGKFRQDTEQYICEDCRPNSYNAQLRMVSHESCIACPAPTSTEGSTGSGSLLDCVCDPGYSAALADDAGAWRCSECGTGRFQPAANSSSCAACPTGTYSVAPTAVSADTCDDCVVGSFADAVASSVCELCTPDSWQDLRAGDARSRPCERCPGNSSSVVMGAVNVSTCVCASGFRLADGSFRAHGAEDADLYGCVLCDAGNFCPGDGASVTCPVNHWSRVRVNAGPCDECAFGSFALVGAGMHGPELCQCVQGTEGNFDSGCALCAPGSFQPCDLSLERSHAGAHCAGLVAGLGARDAATAMQCTPCPADTYSSAHGAVACTACPANSSAPAGSPHHTRCQCDPAFFGEDGAACTLCPADSYCHDGLNNPCRLQSRSPAGSDSADDCVCREGFYSLNATSTCVKCPAGSYCPGGQTVSPCAGNSSSMVGSSLIQQCLCGPGTWRGCVDGRNEAGHCSIDYSIGCFHCGAGDFCFNNTLVHCPEHSSSGVGSDEGADCKCNNGYFNVPTHEHDEHDESEDHTHG